MRLPLIVTALIVTALPYTANAQAPAERANWMKTTGAAAPPPAAVPHDPDQEPTGIREVL